MRKFRYVALNTNVLAVASANSIVMDWCCYIGAVDGINHTVEFHGVAERGSRLKKEIAYILFPEFAEKYEWRR